MKFCCLYHFVGLLESCQALPGANPTIVSYNASVVKVYNTTNSLDRFESKNISFILLKTL
jgi:hypothetical protein